MKLKLLLSLIVIIIAVLATSCGNTTVETTIPQDSETEPAFTEPAETEPVETEPPTEPVTEALTEEPTSAPTSAPTDVPTEAPIGSGETQPAEGGCGALLGSGVLLTVFAFAVMLFFKEGLTKKSRWSE